MQWGKEGLFTKWYWENQTAICKTIKLGLYLTPYTEVNSEWIKDMNVRPETIKCLEENTGNKLADNNIGG